MTVTHDFSDILEGVAFLDVKCGDYLAKFFPWFDHFGQSFQANSRVPEGKGDNISRSCRLRSGETGEARTQLAGWVDVQLSG